jgi:hypothetical protein
MGTFLMSPHGDIIKVARHLFRAVCPRSSAQFSPVEFWGMWLAQVGAREIPNAVSG